MFGFKTQGIRIDALNRDWCTMMERINSLTEHVKDLEIKHKRLHDKLDVLVEHFELSPVYSHGGFTGNKKVRRFIKISKWKKELCKKWGICGRT